MERPLPKGWKWVRLGAVCKINPPKPELQGEQKVTFLPMSAISNKGEILKSQTQQYDEVKKGYTGFIENDVLFAKITPCMENGKGAIARNLINSVGFGSTEFHVIRSSQAILPDFAYSYLTRRRIRKFAEINMVGSAGQKRVPESFLKALKIPLPPLPTQKKIVEILEEADSLRKLRQEADEKMKDLIPSLFVQMFGDPAINPKGWEVKRLGEVCKLINGKAFKPSDWSKVGNPIIRIQNLNDPTKPFNYFNREIESKYLIDTGDILLAWSGTPGTSFGAHFWNGGKGVLNQHIFRIELSEDKITKQVFVNTINWKLYELIREAHGGVGLRHITKGRLENIYIPIPLLPLQQEFSKRVEEIEAEKARQAESKKKLDDLFNSLMQRAFRGELVA